MMPLIHRGSSWIGSLALSCCVVLLMALPLLAAQGGNQTSQTAPDNAATQAAGTVASVPPAAVPEQQPASEAATPAEKAAETEKLITDKRQRVLKALSKKEFSYSPENMLDPFISFIVAVNVQGEAPRPREEEEEAGPPKPQLPLTPLQKMAIGQIERGFKAIIWGDMGMRALIEDDAGKGYIVGVGTPLGGNNGIITDIQNDRLVIQQELWDPNVKQMVPRNVEIKLTKASEKK